MFPSVLAVPFIVACMPVSPFTPSDEHRVDVRDLAPNAKVSLVQAIAAAEKAASGHAVEAELEGARGDAGIRAIYEVDLLTDSGDLIESSIDAITGAVLATERADEEEDASEARAFRRALRHSELTLAQLVDRTSSIVLGRPVAACLESEEGPACEVVVVSGRYLIEMELEARAGHLIEIELVDEWNHEDDDDHDHGDDDHDDDHDDEH